MRDTNRKRRELLESRLELVKLMTRGVPLKDAATEIAKKYPGVSIQSVQTDWQRRSKWLGDIVHVADATFFEQAFFGLKELVPYAWLEFSKAPSGTTAKNRALQTLIDVYCRLMEIMQDSGYAPRAPLKFEATQRIDIEDEALWAELSPEEKGQILAAAEIVARHRKANRNRSTAHEELH